MIKLFTAAAFGAMFAISPVSFAQASCSDDNWQCWIPNSDNVYHYSDHDVKTGRCLGITGCSHCKGHPKNEAARKCRDRLKELGFRDVEYCGAMALRDDSVTGWVQEFLESDPQCLGWGIRE